MTLFLNSLSSVALQVAILFVMMLAGFVLGKAKTLTSAGIKQFTTVLLWLVTPCVIINSFSTAVFSADRLKNMLWVASAALGMHLLGFVLGMPFFKRTADTTKRALRFGIVFSNCGFMSIPLAEAIFGQTGVFYVSVFVVVFNILSWTLGVHIYGQKLNLKKALLNPGVIGFAVALPLFLLNLRLPAIVSEPIRYFSNLNSPLAMLVTGAILSSVSLKVTKSDIHILSASFMRLAVIPIICTAVMLLLKMPKELILITVIPTSAPTASNTSLFAVMFNGDTSSASRLVTVSTLLSIITMPLIFAAVSII